MMFRKNEKRRLPGCVALVVGGLAVVGICSIKRRTKEAISSVGCRMKRMLSPKDEAAENTARE